MRFSWRRTTRMSNDKTIDWRSDRGVAGCLRFMVMVREVRRLVDGASIIR